MDFIWSNVVICSVDVNFHLGPLFQAPHYSQCMSITATILRLSRGPPTSGKSKSIRGTFPDYYPGLQLFQLKGFLYSACNFEMLGIYKLFLLHLLVQLSFNTHTHFKQPHSPLAWSLTNLKNHFLLFILSVLGFGKLQSSLFNVFYLILFFLETLNSWSLFTFLQAIHDFVAL